MNRSWFKKISRTEINKNINIIKYSVVEFIVWNKYSIKKENEIKFRKNKVKKNKQDLSINKNKRNKSNNVQQTKYRSFQGFFYSFLISFVYVCFKFFFNK